MSYRRNAEKAAQQRSWDAFRHVHSALIQRIGLTEPVVSTKDRFLDFLMHGYIDHHEDPTHYSFHWLSDHQRTLLVEFADHFMAEYGELADCELIAMRLARHPKFERES